jgi:hypothetical protein
MSKQIDYVVEFAGFLGDWHQSNSANLGVNRNPFPSMDKALAGLKIALAESCSDALDYRIVRRVRVTEETTSVIVNLPKGER